MQEKEMYTLRELYDNLEVPYAKLGKMADMSEGTVTRIRDGYPARRTTLNRLLRAFSQVYGRQLSLDNVTGVLIEDKHKPEKAEKQPVLPAVVQTTTPISEGRQKRTYKARDTGLPAGAILALDFARNHDVKRETFRDHMINGLGPGLIGMSTDTIPERDHVAHETRPKPGREKETERYLTEQQQHAALEFWKRHDVDYSQCNDFACWCHTFKQEN